MCALLELHVSSTNKWRSKERGVEEEGERGDLTNNRDLRDQADNEIMRQRANSKITTYLIILSNYYYSDI